MVLNLHNNIELDDIPYSNVVNYDFFDGLFFHGTKSYTLNMSDDDRKSFSELCHKIRSKAIALLKENIENPLVAQYLQSEDGGMAYYALQSEESKSFEYDDFYVTPSFFKALLYAKQSAFGEIGNMNYHLVNAIKNLGLGESDREFYREIDIFLGEYSRHLKSDPVVIAISPRVPYKDLRKEGGGILFPKPTNPKFEKYYQMSQKQSIEGLYCGNQVSYRLPNGEYTFEGYVIDYKQFEEAIQKFSPVQDINFCHDQLKKIAREKKKYEIFEKYVSQVRNIFIEARNVKCYGSFKTEMLSRGRSHSISSELEDLVACWIAENLDLSPYKYEIFIDQPIKIQGRRNSKYPDIMICKKDGDNQLTCKYMCDIKTDIGWIRNGLGDLCDDHSKLIEGLSKSGVSSHRGVNKQPIKIKMDCSYYDIIVVSPGNGSVKKEDKPNSQTYLLCDGEHLNSYNDSYTLPEPSFDYFCWMEKIRNAIR